MIVPDVKLEGKRTVWPPVPIATPAVSSVAAVTNTDSVATTVSSIVTIAESAILIVPASPIPIVFPFSEIVTSLSKSKDSAVKALENVASVPAPTFIIFTEFCSPICSEKVTLVPEPDVSTVPSPAAPPSISPLTV